MTSKTLTMKLKERQKQGKPLFVPYIMAGANGLERLPAEIELLTTHGAAAIEIGVPFSDPVADGAVIQAAGMQALANGTTLKDHCCAANHPFRGSTGIDGVCQLILSLWH